VDENSETAETAENFVFPSDRFHALVYGIYHVTVNPSHGKGK
jgi:hypothetical protein